MRVRSVVGVSSRRVRDKGRSSAMELMLDGELRLSSSELRRDERQVGAERRIIFPFRSLSALSHSLPIGLAFSLHLISPGDVCLLAYSLPDD